MRPLNNADSDGTGAPVVRQFAPEQLDPDHFAEAIRRLLDEENLASREPAPNAHPDLLLSPHRATDVVGATRTR